MMFTDFHNKDNAAKFNCDDTFASETFKYYESFEKIT